MQNGRPVARPNDDARGLPKPRHNEQVGAGFFIFRRGTTTGRVKTGHIRHGKIPFEHPSLDSAVAEAERLAGLYGGTYDIVGRVAHVDGGPVRRTPSTPITTN